MAPSIDLSWDPVGDPAGELDVVGYYVYRAEEGGGFNRLNAQPVAASAYRDLSVAAGRTYRYRVTAVDRRGNESGPGGEVRETAAR